MPYPDSLLAGSSAELRRAGQLLLHAASGATRAEVAAILVRFIDRVADPLPEPVLWTPPEQKQAARPGT